MKKLTAVLLIFAGCTVVQNAADSIQRNFRLQQLEYGLSLKDSLILGWCQQKNRRNWKSVISVSTV